MQTSNGIVVRFWKGRDGHAFLDPLTEGSEGAVSDGSLSPSLLYQAIIASLITGLGRQKDGNCL